DNFIYCDTDSLYFKKDIQEKIPKHLFSEFKLGTWDLEHEHIKQFYVLNHKKYAYVDEENEIQVKAGGIPNDSRSEEHTSELQSRFDLVCRLLLEKKKAKSTRRYRLQ